MNASGQLGDGTNNNSISPKQITATSDWTAIAAGSDHTVGLKANGTLWAWGDNTFGQLGNGTNNNSTTPVQVGTDTTWVTIACNGGFTMGLKANGTLWGLGTKLLWPVG